MTHAPTPRVLTVCIVVILAGCAVGPRYLAPDSHLAAFHNWDAVKLRTAASSAPALDQWWLGFDDAELVSIVERALKQNLDLAAAMARVQQARAAARGAHAELLPSADLTATGMTERQSEHLFRR